MQIFINILTSLILLFWPIMVMMSPMMFDAPGSDNDKSNFINLMVVLSYPIALFLFLGVFGQRYLGFNSFVLAVISAIIIASLFSLFGFFDRLSNLTKGIANTGYSVVDSTVYHNGKPLEGADAGTFVAVEDDAFIYTASDYATDKHHLYYNGKAVEGVTVNNLRKEIIDRDIYWFNDTQVIHQDRIIPGANPDDFHTFENFSGWSYSSTNGQTIFYSYDQPLPAVNKDSFTPLNDFFAKDNRQIFEKEKPILPEADAASFNLLEDHDFARDKDNIYYLATKNPFAIPNADVNTFQILGRGYLKDKNHIYLVHQYQSIETLHQVDVPTFEVTQYDESTKSEARDKNHFYYDGKIVGPR